MNIIEGSVSAKEAKIGIVVARFNYFINKNLLKGSIDTFKRIGGIISKNITIVWVPGAYEIPLVVKILIKNKQYDAIVSLATIIKGKTDHFKHISNQCSSKLVQIGLENNIPVMFGILTTKNIKQAIERSGSKFGNKGSEVALSALEMINIIQKIKN